MSDGDGMVWVMLRYAHGDHGPMTSGGLPTAGDLQHWQGAARVQIQTLKVVAPGVLEAYTQTLDAKDRRLIASM
jgi:hypothetical protein